jgi:tetratricopeptide (TPR) repeat protein
MAGGAPGGLLEDAHAAAARGDWGKAYDLFAAADADGELGPDDLAVLAEVAYAAGRLDACIDAWERAHHALSEAGEHVAAAGAAVRVAMHLLFDTALMAPVRGWLRRAERLLDGTAGTPAHAWYAVVRCYERLLSGDVEAAASWAPLAVEIGTACDPAAAAIGQVAEARLRILRGDVDAGLDLLDEAGVAAVSRGLDPLSTGVVYCELVCALQGLAQYDRAEQWTEAMERWSAGNAVGSLHGRCRVHRAEILRLRGAWDEAEVEALEACDELRAYLRRELGWPLVELGRIRLHKGDLDGAESVLREADHAGWEAQPELSLVWLARGEVAAAADAIDDALERPRAVPSKELPPTTELRRAPLLAAAVEVAVAAGEVERARAAAEELADVAARYRSTALLASAAHVRGLVLRAGGDVAGAERALAEASRLWTDVGVPYEAARAGQAHAGADRPAGTATPAVDDSIRREGDYWTVVFDGRTVRVRDTKGMHHLARLLAEPGREFHVLDLVGAEAGSRDQVAAAGTSAGELLDDRAKAAYRRRLAEIDEDLEEATAHADLGRAAQAETERELLLRELSRAVGLGGRDRLAGSASERARAGVTRALRSAIARLAEHDRALGAHLDRTIRTGTYCAYEPDPRTPPRWVL